MRQTSLSQSEIKILAQKLNLLEKEVKVIELICKEYGSPEIATKLKLSPRTIEGMRYRILQKTKSKNVVGIVKFAVINKIYVIK
jgi:DNA-binding CsgD family transcriptional regulator